MEGPEFLIAAIAIVGGIWLTAYIFGNIFKLIRTGIESRSKSGLPSDVVSMKEFIEYKLKVEKRIQTLEAIVVDQDLVDQRKLRETGNMIDVDKDEADVDVKGLRNSLRDRS